MLVGGASVIIMLVGGASVIIMLVGGASVIMYNLLQCILDV